MNEKRRTRADRGYWEQTVCHASEAADGAGESPPASAEIMEDVQISDK